MALYTAADLRTSRTTSSTTRIESEDLVDIAPVFEYFQNYIQHNKDWKTISIFLNCYVSSLPELHPAQQGLKETTKHMNVEQIKHFQNYIQHNKDWKIYKF